MRLFVVLVFLFFIFLSNLFSQQTPIPRISENDSSKSLPDTATIQTYKPVEAELLWANQSWQSARLIKIEDSLLFYQPAQLIGKPLQSDSIGNLVELRLIRHGHLGIVAAVIFGGGALGYLVGLAQGDDPPGWFSFSAEEKGVMLSKGIVFVTALIGGTIELLKEINVDVPLDHLSGNERDARLRSVLDRTYRSAHPLMIGLSGNYVKYGTQNHQMAYQLSVHIPLKPRAWIGINLGSIPWMDWVQEREYHDPYVDSYDKKKSSYQYVTLAFRVFLWARGRALPYFKWGMSYGREKYKTYFKSVYTGQYPSTYEDRYSDEKYRFAIPLGVGCLIPLTRHIRLDLQMEYMIRETHYLRGQVGLNYMF